MHLLEFFRTNGSRPELLFHKFDGIDNEVEVYTTEAEESEMVRLDSLNVLQVVAALDMSDTAIGYFLSQHQYTSHSGRTESLPPSVLLYNNHKSEYSCSSDGLFLRLLISWERETTFMTLLEGCKHIWSGENLLEAA